MKDAQRLIAALPESAALARAREEARRRPIAPVLGSGEADEVALFAGIKPLVRQVVAEREIAAARARFEALGLVVREAEHRVASASTAGKVLFVGRDRRQLEEAVRVEHAPEHDLELGRLLGYPRCCVESYQALPPPKENLVAACRALAATEGRPQARLNVLDLAVFHYVSWIPCSFSCALSLAYADAVARHIAERHGQFLVRGAPRDPPRCPAGCRHEVFVREIDAALGAARIVLLEDVQLSARGALEGDAIRIEQSWPTARDRHPDAVLCEAALEATARLAALATPGTRIAVREGTLWLDDRAIVHAPHAALYAFEPVRS